VEAVGRAAGSLTRAAALALSVAAFLGTCSAPRPCGDGRLVGDEQCDDGNHLPGDGCSTACKIEGRVPDCRGLQAASGEYLGVALVAKGLYSPVDLASPPGDRRRLFVLEQSGRIRIVRDGVLLERPFLDIVERVGDEENEQGLLGIAFHPDYARNGRFFLDYTDTKGDTVIARYDVSADPDVADPASEKVVLWIDQPYPNHNGGQLAFDRSGRLWVGMGDGGRRADKLEAAQDDSYLLGKMLRIDVDVDTPPYWKAPADNPQPNAEGVRALIWSRGMRNPWRYSFDLANDDLYVADVGQDEIEEIDFVPAGARAVQNFGWDLFEGSKCFEPDPAPQCPPPLGFVVPVLEYGRTEGCSITGGYVYRGCAMPDLRGRYFYSDYCTGFVRSFRMYGGKARSRKDHTRELVKAGFVKGNTTSFGQDALGELYVLNRDGNVWKIVPRGSTESPAKTAPAEIGVDARATPR